MEVQGVLTSFIFYDTGKNLPENSKSWATLLYFLLGIRDTSQGSKFVIQGSLLNKAMALLFVIVIFCVFQIYVYKLQKQLKGAVSNDIS